MNINDKNPSQFKFSFKKIINLIKKYRKTSLIIGICLALLLGGLTAFLILSNRPSRKKSTPINRTVKKPEPIKFYSPLTGLEVKDEAATKATVTGVMIENSPEARPQSGLKNSGVVFESISEGGITRFLALYQDEKPQLIGPVRSVRIYFVSWLAGFNAGVAHVGGSEDALAELRNGNYRDLDQFAHSEAYWRSNDRYAPHNMYTSFERLDKLNKSLGFVESKFTGFTRLPVDKKVTTKPTTSQEEYDNEDTTQKTAKNIDVKLSSALFNSSYTYNADTKNYARNQGGAPHLDREDGQIAPSVVIAMFVDRYTVNYPQSREVPSTIGSGRALIFQNGLAIEGTWSKPSQFEQISFKDNNGQEIPLARGQTWITAVPSSNGSVTYN